MTDHIGHSPDEHCAHEPTEEGEHAIGHYARHEGTFTMQCPFCQTWMECTASTSTTPAAIIDMDHPAQMRFIVTVDLHAAHECARGAEMLQPAVSAHRAEHHAHEDDRA